MNGGELFTHLYQREKFTEDEVRIYIGEIIIAIEHLHRVSETIKYVFVMILVFCANKPVHSHLARPQLKVQYKLIKLRPASMSL